MRSPFKPGFGNSPRVLAGRRDLLAQFADAIDDGPGSFGRTTLYTGARGTGKTVMLNEVADIAARRGWLVISETATPGFVERLVTQHLPALLQRIDTGAITRRLTGVNAPVFGGGVTWQTTDHHLAGAGLRSQMTRACELLEATGTGLLVTLDEIHSKQVDELRDFFTTLQHLIREDREVAFAAAGLPSSVSDLLNDAVLTFLRRADRHVLGAVAIGEVERTLRETIESAGRAIGAAACSRAARATGGYPFLIQLIGDRIWRQRSSDHEITEDDVVAGVDESMRRMSTLVHEPALADLSAVARTFLAAMSADDGPARIADVAARLGVDANYANQYRRRLMAAEMIAAAGHGRIDFTVPYMREYLRSRAAPSDLAPLSPGP